MGGGVGSNLLKSKLIVIGPVTVAVVWISKARLPKMENPGGKLRQGSVGWQRQGSVGVHGSVGMSLVIPDAVTLVKLILTPPNCTVTFRPTGVGALMATAEAASCETLKVRPAMVSVPVRAAPLLAATE